MTLERVLEDALTAMWVAGNENEGGSVDLRVKALAKKVRAAVAAETQGEKDA